MFVIEIMDVIFKLLLIKDFIVLNFLVNIDIKYSLKKIKKVIVIFFLLI